MPKSILIGISPNVQADDVRLALKLLFQPKRWQTGKALTDLTRTIEADFPGYHCYLMNAGRTALYLALNSLGLKPGDEVIHLAFTCEVVPEAIRLAGAVPVSVKNLTKAKISSRTRAIIAQHTFGIPDDLDELSRLCRTNNLVLIEDCAHSLGAKYKGKRVGSFGEMTILTFGRDKIISSVFGGALLSRRRLELPNLPLPGKSWIARQILHPILLSVAVPTYFFGGKYLIWLYRRLGLITLPLQALPPERLPNALAAMALNQWRKLDRLNRHRQELARFYARELKQPFFSSGVYLRFPLKVPHPKKLLLLARRHQLLLGNWYNSQIINLPTHIRINLADAARVVKFIKRYAGI